MCSLQYSYEETAVSAAFTDNVSLVRLYCMDYVVIRKTVRVFDTGM
jgi:hypothetical protein